MEHKHSVYDTDAHFSINPVTRVLKNEGSTKAVVIQHDHNSERMTFQIPRYIEGHDMFQCNVVQIHYINIDTQTRQQSRGVYEVTDMQVSPEDSNVVICSWLISHSATKYAGSLNFLVRFSCVDDQANIEYAWNTAICNGISVSNGINNGEAVAEEYTDILEQWYEELVSVSGGTSEDVGKRLTELERQMAELTYTKITASLSVSPSTKEYGDSITGAELTWNVSKPTKSITLTLPTGQDISVDGKTSYTDDNEYKITSKKTWTLTATEEDRGESTSPTASVTCQYRVYWGVGTEASAFDSDFVTELKGQDSTLTNSKNRTLSFDSINNSYVYYVIPTVLGTPTFQIGEFPVTGGFESGVIVSVDTGFKDANGNPIMLDYNLYRSSNLLTNDEPFKVYIT